MNYHAECGSCIYLGPEREAIQSGHTVETLQLYSAALRYVLISIAVKCRTRGSNPRGICKALTSFSPVPDHLYRSKALYYARDRIWLCPARLAVHEHPIRRAMPSNLI